MAKHAETTPFGIRVVGSRAKEKSLSSLWWGKVLRSSTKATVRRSLEEEVEALVEEEEGSFSGFTAQESQESLSVL